jgi:uncharacterized membrane protein YgaE (UPF0421/DUF939 family)
MKDSVFLTVVTGVLVFVLGQFIIKLILEPLTEYRKNLGLLSSHLLKELNVILHGDASEEITEELRRLSAMVLSSSYVVPLYSLFASILSLPSKEKLIEATRSLNVIISDLTFQNNPKEFKDTKNQRYERLKTIEDNLKIKVTYGYDPKGL